jgi:hypothetical protein
MRNEGVHRRDAEARRKAQIKTKAGGEEKAEFALCPRRSAKEAESAEKSRDAESLLLFLIFIRVYRRSSAAHSLFSARRRGRELSC